MSSIKSEKKSNKVSPSASPSASEPLDFEVEIKHDDWYYGTIPDKCLYYELVTIMANALIKFRNHYHASEKEVNYENLLEIMRLWFEHDSNAKVVRFDHLVPEEKSDSFEKEVLHTIAKLTGPKKPSLVREALVKYSKEHCDNYEEYYVVKYYTGSNYFGLDLNSILICAKSRLEAIIIWHDYLSDHLFSKYISDYHEPEIFNDTVSSNISKIRPETKHYTKDQVKMIFEHKKIDSIIEDYVDTEFDNDSLWLEKCSPPVCLTLKE